MYGVGITIQHWWFSMYYIFCYVKKYYALGPVWIYTKKVIFDLILNLMKHYGAWLPILIITKYNINTLFMGK